jgi:hypothetical protein
MSKLYPRSQSLAIFANNEVRFKSRNHVPSKSSGDDKRDIKAPEYQEDFWYLAWLSRLSQLTTTEGGGVCVADLPASACQAVSGEVVAVVEGGEAAPLGRTPKFHEKEGRNGYGKLPDNWPNFSFGAKRKINLRGAAVDRLIESGTVPVSRWFFTGTLPGSTDEALKTFASWSSWLMDRTQKWLRDNFSIDGENLYHLGVWELQERGALHYHAMIVTRPGLERDYVQAKFQEFWFRLLDQLSDHTWVDLYARSEDSMRRSHPDVESWRGKTDQIAERAAYAQEVEKSISAYLAKYLGKSEGKQQDKGYPPTRWWACTRSLKSLETLYHEQEILPGATNEQGQELSALFLELATTMAAAFTATLKDSYNGADYAVIAIFDSRADAWAFYELCLRIFNEALAENRTEQEFWARAKWEIDMERVRQKLELEYEASCQEVLNEPWRLRYVPA